VLESKPYTLLKIMLVWKKKQLFAVCEQAANHILL